MEKERVSCVQCPATHRAQSSFPRHVRDMDGERIKRSNKWIITEWRTWAKGGGKRKKRNRIKMLLSF